MSVEAPECAAILGPGVMGAQIALSLALGGVRATLWGRRAEALQPALDRCAEGFDLLAGHDLADPAMRAAVLGRIDAEPSLEKAVSGRGFVIEAVAEDLTLKQSLLRRAEQSADSDAVLSSTTSALSATRLQAGLQRPENFCIAHYAQPAHLVELVEIVPGQRTAPAATEAVTLLMRATGKTPVLCPDIPGFLWARIQHAVLREFATLVGKGLVAPEACDAILKVGYASRLPAMGAFEHADLAGLDLITSEAARAVWADLSNLSDPGDTAIGDIMQNGRLGMKSGRGFYDWTARDPDAFKAERDAEIIRRLKIRRKNKNLSLAPGEGPS